MTTVELGTNRFVDCRAILAHQGTDVLSVALAPLRATLRVPAEAGGLLLAVEDGSVTTGNHIATVADDHVFAVFAGERLVLVAVLRASNTVHLRLHLRPLGLLVYDDIDGLHIGTNVFSKNEITGAGVAIALG